MVAGAIVLVSPRGAEAVEPVEPVEAYGQLPQFATAKLSPDGRHYATLEPINGEMHLVVYKPRSSGRPSRRVFPFRFHAKRPERITGVMWVNNDRLIIRYRFAGTRRGNPVIESRMLALDRDFRNQNNIPRLFPRAMLPAGSRNRETMFRSPQVQDDVISMLPEDPDAILVELTRNLHLSEAAKRSSILSQPAPEHNVYKVDVFTGAMKRVERGKIDVAGYMADPAGKVRFRAILNSQTGIYQVRDVGSNDWRTVYQYERKNGPAWRPLAFSDEPDEVYAEYVGATGRTEISLLNMATMVRGEKVLARDDLDIDGVIFDEEFGRIIGVGYTDHYPIRIYLEEPYQSLMASVDLMLPGTQNYLVSSDKARRSFIILSESDVEPGFYSLIDLDESGRPVKIGTKHKDLTRAALRPVEPVQFMARDDLKIPAYLTHPEGQGPFPLIVIPHGGPNSRVTREFNYEVQFLASRGYAVLQPNFRGSTGYGSEFENLGHGEWGMKMQDDVADGVKAMIDLGVADPSRVCIVGWSYGGYAALMGAIKTPDLYQCAVSRAPVTDLNKWMSERSRYLYSTNNDPRLGNRWSDRGRMRDTSPINNVDAITIPILLVHGDNDRIVPVDHSQLMAKRLREHGVEARFLLLAGGDHYLSLERNRILYLQELEAFLSQHIGG